jgi:hypothetical protein
VKADTFRRATRGLLCALLGLAAREGGAQTAQTADCPRPELAVSRYQEDYAFLKDPACRAELWDPIKYIPLVPSFDTYLSLGADLRERYELLDHPDFSDADRDTDGYLLQRYMVHADLHIGEHVRAFAQLKSGLEDGRTGGPRPSDEDRLDLHQAFAEGRIDTFGASSLSLRAGRQEVAFGSSRLVSVREGPNVRRSFDGVRATAAARGWQLDGIGLASAETERGEFDDETDRGERLWGAYAAGPVLGERLGLDLYFLGLRRDDSEYDQGTHNERRRTIGTRIWGAPGAWDYNVELVYQWGSFGGGDIAAWTVASDTGYSLEELPTQPRLGLRANVTSGDRDGFDSDLETFNPLFPRGSYFGEASLIGPQNHMDLHPMLDLHVLENVQLTLAWDFFWRESRDDAIYRVSGTPLVSGAVSDERYVGSQGSFAIAWQPERHVELVAAYERFFAGPFLDDADRRDVNFVAIWVSFRI